MAHGCILRGNHRHVPRLGCLGLVLVHEQVHVVVSCLVRLLELVVKQLRVVNAEPAVLAPHPHHFLNHVETSLWNLRACILLTNDLTNGLVLVVLELQQGLLLGAPWLLTFLFLGVLTHDLVRLHKAVVIFVHDVVFLGMDGRVRPLRRR